MHVYSFNCTSVIDKKTALVIEAILSWDNLYSFKIHSRYIKKNCCHQRILHWETNIFKSSRVQLQCNTMRSVTMKQRWKTLLWGKVTSIITFLQIIKVASSNDPLLFVHGLKTRELLLTQQIFRTASSRPVSPAHCFHIPYEFQPTFFCTCAFPLLTMLTTLYVCSIGSNWPNIVSKQTSSKLIVYRLDQQGFNFSIPYCKAHNLCYWNKWRNSFHKSSKMYISH